MTAVTKVIAKPAALVRVMAVGLRGLPGDAEGIPGADGASAYEVAVANGFVGDQTAWLASLVGAAGADGADGADGAAGSDGADGASAYEVAVANGFVGDETAWLASLVGATGATGATGPAGADGADAVVAGSTGEVQFNTGGSLDADPDLSYDKATQTLSVPTLAVGTITGPNATTGTGIVVGEGSDARSLSLSPGDSAPTFAAGMSVMQVLHEGNVKTVGGQSISGSGNIAVSATVNRSITAQFDGGTTDGNLNNIEVGDEVVIRSPYAITLSDWTLLLSDATGNVSIDVQTKPFSSGSFASITSSGTPSAVSGANAEGTVSGWSSSSITSGHLIKLVVTARSGVVPRATLQLNGVQA